MLGSNTQKHACVLSAYSTTPLHQYLDIECTLHIAPEVVEHRHRLACLGGLHRHMVTLYIARASAVRGPT